MRSKIISIMILAIATFSFIYFLLPAKSQGQRDIYYQSGELLMQNGKQILIAPNGREIEFIEITKDDRLVKAGEIKAIGSPYQAIIRQTPVGNYAIAPEGDFIVYYDVSDINNVRVVKKVGPFLKYYDYYYDIAPYKANQFLTAGEKGITIWDANTLSIAEKVYDKRTTNVEGYNSSIYGIGEEGAVIFNAERKKIIDPYIQVTLHQHQIFVDDIGTGYFPGDDVLKLRTYTTYKNLSHPSKAGNAATGFYGGKEIYFVNGWNTYKLASNLEIIKTLNTSRKKNEWTAGIKAFDLSQGKRLVLFNGRNILLIDENLDILDEYEYLPLFTKKFNSKTMRVSPAKGFQDNPVMVMANGFWPGEDVILKFAGEVHEMRSNNAGEIMKIINVPELQPCKTPILTSGKLSGFSHSFMFEIQEK